MSGIFKIINTFVREIIILSHADVKIRSVFRGCCIIYYTYWQ